MDFGAVTCGNGEGGICVEAVDVASLDDASLDARLRLIGQGRNRLEGFLAEVVAEKTRRSSSFDALNSLKGELRQSGHQAQRTMRSADQLEKLEATRDALVDSRINSEHARILGSAAESGPMDEAKMRAALEARDQGCIGCAKAPEWCVSHHIVEWQDGGPTQPDNLVLVCHDCHQKVHYRNWAVEKYPDTGRRYLRPPWQEPPKSQGDSSTPLAVGEAA